MGRWQVGTATSLGGNTIDLAVLEPFEATEVSLPVITEKRGEKGTFTFRLLFTPESEYLAWLLDD